MQDTAVVFYITGASTAVCDSGSNKSRSALQMKSNFKTMPSYGFGSCAREQREKRFLTSGHTRVLQGTYSPSGFGNQQVRIVASVSHQYVLCEWNDNIISSAECPQKRNVAGCLFGVSDSDQC
ncbi:hypothetical protein BSKO_05041 [Bryopsis sp. KO-2023]|nr:hypothetical protein BSKO_05041 [Bryopsis sp. KO-2023]